MTEIKVPKGAKLVDMGLVQHGTVADLIAEHIAKRCKTCGGEGYEMWGSYRVWRCPACHGTGRKETSDGD